MKLIQHPTSANDTQGAGSRIASMCCWSGLVCGVLFVFLTILKPNEQSRGWRNDFINLNSSILSLSNRMGQLKLPQRTNLILVDVGSASNADGDTIAVAIQKVVTNFSHAENALR